MSRNGHGNGKGNGNGNGTGKKTWNLTKDGMLWKVALHSTTEEFQDRARAFVIQLQESVGPTDALQGLLLDRIAAGYLRKQLLLGVEAANREYSKTRLQSEPMGGTAALQKLAPAAFGHHLRVPGYEGLLRFESLLDQAFHRDLILLLQLKEAAPLTPAPRAKKTNSDRTPIEGEIVKSDRV